MKETRAQKLARILNELDELLAEGEHTGAKDAFSTDDLGSYARMARHFLGKTAEEGRLAMQAQANSDTLKSQDTDDLAAQFEAGVKAVQERMLAKWK